jgi:hypothetical protein
MPLLAVLGASAPALSKPRSLGSRERSRRPRQGSGERSTAFRRKGKGRKRSDQRGHIAATHNEQQGSIEPGKGEITLL